MKLKKRTISYLYYKRKTRVRTFYKYFETGKLLNRLFDSGTNEEIYNVIVSGGKGNE